MVRSGTSAALSTAFIPAMAPNPVPTALAMLPPTAAADAVADQPAGKRAAEMAARHEDPGSGDRVLNPRAGQRLLHPLDHLVLVHGTEYSTSSSSCASAVRTITSSTRLTTSPVAAANCE